MPQARRQAGPTPNLYEYLQVSPTADSGVIHAAYRALARQYHPDVNTGGQAPKVMRELNAAYHVLSDPARRARYDAHRARHAIVRGERRRSEMAALRIESSARAPSHAHRAAVQPLVVRRGGLARPVIAAFLVSLMFIGMLVLLVVALANLDDRPPNAGGQLSASFEMRERPLNRFSTDHER